MDTFLHFHRYFGWLILLVGIFVVIKHVTDWFLYKRATPLASRTALIYVSILHLQLVLGVVVYFISPLTSGELPADWLQDPEIRFRVLEHPLGMFFAIFIAQFGRSLSKRKQEASAIRLATLSYAVSFAIILASIPWGRL